MHCRSLFFLNLHESGRSSPGYCVVDTLSILGSFAGLWPAVNEFLNFLDFE
jgi:hypothetical protein